MVCCISQSRRASGTAHHTKLWYFSQPAREGPKHVNLALEVALTVVVGE